VSYFCASLALRVLWLTTCVVWSVCRGSFQNGEFVQIGFWSENGGLEVSGSIIWPGNNPEASPSQEVPRHLIELSPGLADGAIVVTVCVGGAGQDLTFSTLIALLIACVARFGQVLLGLCCLGFHYLISLNSSHEVIKASSPLFCHIILAGGDIAVVMCGLSAMSNELQCRLVPSLTAIAFSTIFGALLAKTWRIHKIFNSEGLKIKTPSNNALLFITSAMPFCFTLLICSCGVWW
jgi:hypothetical protein